MSQKNLITGIAVVAGIAVIILFFFIGNPFMSSDQLNSTLNQGQSGDTGQLVAQDEVVGTGAEAKIGSKVRVNYTGKLQNGTVFDTSVGQAPIEFTLGAGDVIPGWEQGIQGMKVGGKRLLIIPPSLAYGATGYGPIPANATLIFEVQLVGISQ